MARSLVSPSQDVIRALARDFTIVDEQNVVRFLESFPDVLPLLFETRAEIRRFFGEGTVKLETFVDPEWPAEQPTLVMNVQMTVTSRETLDRLREFDRKWWLEKLEASNAPLLVSFEHVRGV
jgi:hypothetical protein